MMVDDKPLRHSVTIEQQTGAPDGQGGKIISWTTYLSGMARIKPISARERMSGGQLESDISHTIRMRYRKDKTITADMRVNYTVGETTRLFQIKGTLNVDEENRWLLLTCAEGPAS